MVTYTGRKAINRCLSTTMVTGTSIKSGRVKLVL
jgi:hypothetical protein